MVLLSGSFLVPDWNNLHKYIHQPEKFLLYRINGNDPLNSPKRQQNTGIASIAVIATLLSVLVAGYLYKQRIFQKWRIFTDTEPITDPCFQKWCICIYIWGYQCEDRQISKEPGQPVHFSIFLSFYFILYCQPCAYVSYCL